MEFVIFTRFTLFQIIKNIIFFFLKEVEFFCARVLRGGAPFSPNMDLALLIELLCYGSLNSTHFVLCGSLVASISRELYHL
ncbi:unnamed protein product [Trifolium pratense]|uniref:Uncharacterized protein n=1 Tax=Trifolium pratense TaxID=57577 RepID=A0ACB0JA63_TRIPR|nr:unnamed protein product [Trifolium pratense]